MSVTHTNGAILQVRGDSYPYRSGGVFIFSERSGR
jgi:hypothetical protein